MSNRLTKINVVRIIIAITYLFSGITKYVDYLNTSVKIEEYTKSLALNLPLIWIDTSSIIIIFLELCIGVYLMLGIKKILFSYLALITTFSFTILTLYFSFSKNLLSCGCYGNFLELPLWISFSKNVILLILCIINCRNCDNTKKTFQKASHAWFLILMCVATIIFTQPIYDYSFFKKNEYLYNFNTKAHIAPFDFSVIDKKGKPHTSLSQDIYEKNDTIVLAMLYNTNKIPPKELEKFMSSTLEVCKTNKREMIVITTSNNEILNKYKEQCTFALADKSSIRNIISGPIGILVTSQGLIIEKWEQNNLYIREIPKTL